MKQAILSSVDVLPQLANVVGTSGRLNAFRAVQPYFDFDTIEFPRPLGAVPPPGSLIHAGSTSSVIINPADTDAFTLPIDPLQRLTLAVTPLGGTLQPDVSVFDPDGLLLSRVITATPGQKALLDNIGLLGLQGGTMRIVVAGAAGTTGAFSIDAALNAGLEIESALGPSNNSLATAEFLTSSFVPLREFTGGISPSRGGVIGQLAPQLTGGPADSDYYRLDLEAGQSPRSP